MPSAYQERNRAAVLGVKAGGCVLCGESALPALDLHHVDEGAKVFDVGMKWPSVGYQRLLDELAKCVVLCSNHHRMLHNGMLSLCPATIRGMAKERRLEIRMDGALLAEVDAEAEVRGVSRTEFVVSALRAALHVGGNDGVLAARDQVRRPKELDEPFVRPVPWRATQNFKPIPKDKSK